MSRPTDLDADLELVLEAIREAGRAVMAAFRTDLAVRHKAPDQPVTEADLAADRILRDRLAAARPQYGWLSEESGTGPDRWGRSRVWMVDPIDGTRSFIEGYAEFGLSVALVEGAAPVLGVVHNPATADLFWAVRGGGAYSGRRREAPERLTVDTTQRRRPGLLASRTEVDRGELQSFDPDWDVRPLGGTAFKMASVAAGRAPAYVSRGLKHEWDVAAGALLVWEAGGRVTDARGEPLRFNRRDTVVAGVIAGAPAAHDRLLGRAVGPGRRDR